MNPAEEFNDPQILQLMKRDLGGDDLEFQVSMQTLQAAQREKLTDEQNAILEDLLAKLEEQVKFHIRGTRDYEKYVEWKLGTLGNISTGITSEERKK